MEFQSELEILRRLRHRNIVQILGYCISGDNDNLIYEFFEKHNLEICLHDFSCWDSSSISSLPLPWETRHKILRGVANGLAYMHDLDKPIIPTNLKERNVLLDLEFEAHISDFGLAGMIEAQFCHVTTKAEGTVDYMPAEYEHASRIATVKGDVYTYGGLDFGTGEGKGAQFTDGC